VLHKLLQLARKFGYRLRTSVKSRRRVLEMTDAPLCVSLNSHHRLDRVYRRIDFRHAGRNHSCESLQQTYIVPQQANP